MNILEVIYRDHKVTIEPSKLPGQERWTADIEVEKLGETEKGIRKTDLPDFATQGEAVKYANQLARHLIEERIANTGSLK